jgi:aminoglycoside phosphotransferase (APT) family kinase protein
VLASIEAIYERCLAASPVTTAEDVDWCRDTVERDAGALDVPFQPTVVHHDYKEANSVFERTADGWRLSGVFDLMECYFGDPEEDFARAISGYGMRNESRGRVFMEGYLGARSLRPGYRERFRIYLLRDCLILWEYGQRNGLWFEPGLKLRPWLAGMLAPDPFPTG